MNYLELSNEMVKKESKKLYKLINNDKYNYDLVIFVARGSLPIAMELSKLKKVPLLEIKATRKGNKIKKILSPFIKLIPKKLKILLRNKEVSSNVHEKNIERNVTYNENIWKKHIKCQSILIVDDSVDTGYSIKACKEEIEKFFPNSNIKIAAFNYFEKSSKNIKVDWFIYKDTMLNGPWSNDSKYHKEFVDNYNNWYKTYMEEK
ncbi:MAG: phosphoribosyltransferase [Bacilli bacterium]|nr:phosphoribosyltransferase [Bacilli bacterium]